MISAKTLKALEFDKIISSVSDYAVLDRTKENILSVNNVSSLEEAQFLLQKTKEAYTYLYTYSVAGVYYFSDVSESLEVAEKGGTLSIKEILRVNSNLKSARIMKSGIQTVTDESLTIILELTDRLFTEQSFEKEIERIFISEDELSDNASSKLFTIRKNIRNLNAKIRDRLNSLLRGSYGKFLTDSIVTMRQDRYVVPVKAEYRNQIKGFIHDQSQSKSTVFIEPAEVMELNNELKKALLDEEDEIKNILRELSVRIAGLADYIRENHDILSDIDTSFAKAIYSFKNKCSYPIINDKGIIEIDGGRHPLIDKDKVVPINVSLGEKYRYLLITGPNTGGKTVTLKLVGLFCLMAMNGIYIPCYDQSRVSFFNNIFCDIGDEQSIEQSLSTFSSHIKNIIEIIDNVDQKSLVLLDELGGGTDPEEGSALALAIIEKLLYTNSVGIITTHYSKLKEFAVDNPKIENASMEFDAKTLKPVYKINIGIPGSSNAIEIAKTLGLEQNIIDNALKNISNSQISFEKVLKKAEESRRLYDELCLNAQKMEREKALELERITAEKEQIIKERERIYNTSRQEIKSIVSDKLADAEEIVDQLKEILKEAELDSRAMFKANELKNRLKNSKYLDADFETVPFNLKKEKIDGLKIGNKAFVKSLGVYGVITNVKKNKNEVEVQIGTIKSIVNANDVYNQETVEKGKTLTVKKRSVVSANAPREINVIGKTSLEALTEVENFIDQAVVNGLEEVKIIHGVGAGILLKEIRKYLKSDKNVVEFRKGQYGEGENGVTLVKLK